MPYSAGTAHVSITPDMRGFQTSVRREVEKLPAFDLKMKLTVDTSQVKREIAGLSAPDLKVGLVVDKSGLAKLQALAAATSITVLATVVANTVQARTELARVQREADQIGRSRPTIQVTVDVVQALMSLARLAVQINQWANKDINVRVDVQTASAVAGVALLAAKISALGGLAGVIGGLGGAIAGLGAAGAVAAGGIAPILLSFRGIGDAFTALKDQQKSAAVDGAAAAAQQVASARQVASAQLGLVRASRDAAQARADAEQSVSRAAASADQARKDGARDVARAIADSEQSIADARNRAATQYRSAVQQQEQAEKAAQRATADLRYEQSQLNRAWEEGRRSLQDLQDQLDSSNLDQEQAAFDLVDARKRLDQARAGGNTDEIARADLAYRRQLETVDQIGKRTARLAVDNGKAQAAGVAGSDQVVAANGRIASAQDAVTDSAARAKDAADNVNQVRIDGAVSVAKAESDGAQRVADAREQAARRSASAEQQLVDARESANRQVVSADEQVADAQRALQAALDQTATKGTAAADKVAQAFAGLSPAAADFARYLFSLQPILDRLSATSAATFLPGLAAGIAALVAQIDVFDNVIGIFGKSAGAAVQTVLTAFASPVWLSFFQTLANASTTIMPALAQLFLAFAGAARDLILALLPLAPAGIAIGMQFAGLITTLTPFIAQLLGGLIPAASAFLTALTPLGPVLAALQPILLVLGQAFATVLMAVLQALAPILVALTPLIQALAVEFATHLVGAIQTLTPLLVGLADWLSAHPALVIGVIKVVAGLALAFQPLLLVLSLVATAVRGFLIRFAALTLLRAAGLEATLFGRALILLLSPIELIKRAFGFLVSIVGRLLSPMQLITGAGRLLSGVILAIGRAILGALGPFGIILTILGFLYTSNEQFRTTVQNLLQVLIGLGTQLISSLMPAFQAVMDAITPLIPMLIDALVPVFQVLAGVLVDLVNTVLPPLVQILQDVVVPVIQFLAQVLSTVLVWIIKNVVVPAIQGLAWVIKNVIVPVILWLSDNIIKPVFTAIGAVISWVVTNVIRPVLEAIVWYWQNVLGPAATWLWENVIQPVFKALGEFISWVWENVIKPAWEGLVWYVQNVLAPVATWLWENVIRPVFQALGDFIAWVWTNIIKPAWDGLVIYTNTIFIPLVRFLWENVIKPVFQAIGDFIAMVWNSIIKPSWDALVWTIQNIITPAVTFLWNNVIKPAFDGIGQIIKWVWDNVIKPTFDAIVQGVDFVQKGFQTAVDWIGRIWNGLRSLLAKPINFMIGTVFNKGIVPAWNFAADLLPGIEPIGPLPLIPELAAGGMLSGPGTGTSDSILGVSRAGVPTARVSNGEFVIREKITKKVAPFLAALNNGDGEALQAAGLGASSRRYRGKSGIGMYAAGGPVEARIAQAKNYARTVMRDKPYVWGGGDPLRGFDCSGAQAIITHILSGRDPRSGRIGTTASMPWGGFERGLGSAYAIGNKPSDHMAATLAGDNLEQHGPTGSPFQFPSRWGADNGYFTQQYNLPIVGGQFVSGGQGGGGLGNFILDAIRNTFDTLTNPPIAGLKALMGDPPPQFRAIPPAQATTVRDSIRDFLFSKAEATSGGGDGVGDVSGITGPVVEQVRQVANRYGWGSGPEWDALYRLVQGESGWNPNAANPTSSARGLFQKLTSVNGPVEDTPAGQAAWGLNYIKGRYGTPSSAYSQWLARSPHWYDSGGWLPPGATIAHNSTGAPEAVLTNRQWSAVDTMIRNDNSQGPLIGSLSVPVPAGAGAKDVVDEVMFAVRHARRTSRWTP